MSALKAVVHGAMGLILGASVWIGCGSESGGRGGSESGAGGPSNDTPAFVCVEDSDADGFTCRCKAPTNGCDDEGGCHFGSDDFSADDGNVLACEGFPCCVKTARECRCEGDAETCALRADQLGGEVVDACESGTTPEMCAAEGERCSPRHDVEQPSACCEGLVCATSEEGIATCRMPKGSQAELSRLCERGARNDTYPPVRVKPVVTSLGTINVEQTLDSYGTLFSPTGCIGHLELSLGDFRCGLSVHLDRQADGELEVTYLSVSTSECEGASVEDDIIIADAEKGAQIAATVEAELLTCTASLTSDRYCAGGSLTIRFDGPVVGGGFNNDDKITFEEPLEVEFGLCGKGSAELACP